MTTLSKTIRQPTFWDSPEKEETLPLLLRLLFTDTLSVGWMTLSSSNIEASLLLGPHFPRHPIRHPPLLFWGSPEETLLFFFSSSYPTTAAYFWHDPEHYCSLFIVCCNVKVAYNFYPLHISFENLKLSLYKKKIYIQKITECNKIYCSKHVGINADSYDRRQTDRHMQPLKNLSHQLTSLYHETHIKGRRCKE